MVHGMSPLSTNASVGNIDEPPKLKAPSVKSASSVMISSSLKYDSLRRTPLRTRTSQNTPTARHTPQSQRSRLSSLPGFHYSAALPSPTNFNISHCEEGKDNSDASFPSSGISLGDEWTRASALARGRYSGEGQCDKENGGPTQYSPPCLENVKSKIAKNKLRRDAIAKSDSLRSILTLSSRDRTDDGNAAIKATTSKAPNPAEASSIRAVKRDLATSSDWRTSGGKRYKVNLAPRIVASESCAVNCRRQKIDHARNVTMTTAALKSPSATKRQSATASMRQQTRKCLREALEIMQSESHESDCSGTGEGPSDDDASECCSKKGSDCQSMCSGSNTLSSHDPFFARLNAKLDSFKNRRRLAGRETSASAAGGSLASSHSGSLSNSNELSQAQSVGRSSRASSVAASWLVGRMTESGVAASTFSVSPITKEPSSTVVGSYIGSVRLDSKGNETNTKSTRGQQPIDYFAETRPKDNLSAQAKETISGCSKLCAGAKKEPVSVGSYIGSVHLEGPKNEPPDGCDKSAPTSVRRESPTQCDEKAPASTVQVAPRFVNTITMVPINRGKESDKTSNIERCKSFPLPSIDVTPDNKSKGTLSLEDDDTLSPLPPQRQNTITSMGYTCSSSSSVFRNHSPVPSLAHSRAPSYATSMATETTTSSQNLFDMLRNTIGEGKSSDFDSPPVLPSSTLPASNRPPLSPIPSMRSGKRQGHRGCSRAQGGTVLTPKPNFPRREQMATSKITLSPMIVRGTPCKTPCSYASSDLPDSGSSAFDEDSPDASAVKQMEFSFLANALVATNILTTPPANPDKKDADTDSDEVTALNNIQNSEDLLTKEQTKCPFSSRGDKAVKQMHQQLNYPSIGAMSSSRPRSAGPSEPAGPAAKNINSMAIESEANTKLLPIHQNANGGHRDLPEYIPGFAAKNSEKIAQASEDGGRPSIASMRNILSIASQLDDTSSFYSSDQSGSVTSRKSEVSQEGQIAELAEKVKLKAYLDGGLRIGARMPDPAATSKSKGIIDSKESNQEEIVKLHKRINWLESELKGNAMTLEQRVEKEMALKEEASQQVLKLTADIESVQDVQKNVEECIRERVRCLEGELESERRMRKEEHERMESNRTFTEENLREERRSPEERLEYKMSQVTKQEASAELGRSIKVKDEEIKQMQRANKDLEQKLRTIGKELTSCAEDNDTLRTRLLSLAAESSARECTLSEAVSQLKSLSESHYHVQTSLEKEREGRQEEVLSLQSALDDTSCEMIKLSRKSNELQAENGFLRDQLRIQRLEKARSMVFRRAARGG